MIILPSVTISAQSRANNVAKMGDVVNIGQGGCNKHISFTILGKTIENVVNLLE